MVLGVESGTMLSVPETADVTAPESISDRDRDVFERYWDYDFRQDGFSHPSQALVARDLDRSQSSVSRSIKRLIDAGFMRLHEKRRGSRFYHGRRWTFHVYELLVPGRARFDGAAKRIVERARAKKLWTTASRISRAVHTNHEVVVEKVEFSGIQRRRMSAVMVR
jgi:DNA-binding transcriptional ArsR family regulator